MKRPATPAQIPPHDYGVALQDAVSWLGERYLLATPAPRRPEEQKTYFIETRRWYGASRKPAHTRH